VPPALQVDIWQVGCLTHELLCGSMAFEVRRPSKPAAAATRSAQLPPLLCRRCPSVVPPRLVPTLQHGPECCLLIPSTAPLAAALLPCCLQLEDLLQTGGLILWADLDVPPAPLAPDCLDFVRQALTKDPARRPTADELQQVGGREAAPGSCAGLAGCCRCTGCAPAELQLHQQRRL